MDAPTFADQFELDGTTTLRMHTVEGEQLEFFIRPRRQEFVANCLERLRITLTNHGQTPRRWVVAIARWNEHGVAEVLRLTPELAHTVEPGAELVLDPNDIRGRLGKPPLDGCCWLLQVVPCNGNTLGKPFRFSRLGRLDAESRRAEALSTASD